jgi:hypothetical protein
MEATEKQRAIDALRALPEHATLKDAIERLRLRVPALWAREVD